MELFYGRCLRPGLIRARLRSVAFGEPSPAYPYRIFFVLGVSLVFVFWFLLGDIFLWGFFNWAIFWWNYFMGDAFGPGYCGLAYARLPSANQALRIPIAFFIWVYLIMLLGDVLSWSCVFNLGDAFGPGYSGLAYTRLLLRNEPGPTYPYRVFYKIVKSWNWHRLFWR